MDSDWVVPGYRNVRVLGEGASGQVILAEHLESGIQVAIKYLSPELLADEEFLARFRDEARLLADLNDPNLVYFYEYFEAWSGAAIVMELVDGVSLNQILAAAGPTTPEAALAVLKGSLLGLGVAHGAGIVHRDYKPGNVLVDADGNSKLADFGIAVRAGQGVQAAGTPAYMPPEQWSGAPVTPAADVYAATAVFYELLTGQRPYQARTLPELARAHQAQPIPIGNVPDPLQGLIAMGMAKNVQERPPTADYFLYELEGVAGAAYGPEWEERGRSHLCERALALAMLFPLLAGHEQASSGVATTVLATAPAKSGSRSTLGLVTAGALALLILGGSTTAFVWASNDKSNASAHASSTPSAKASDSPSDDDNLPAADPSASATPSSSIPGTSADPSASASPSTSKSGSPSPSPSTSKPGNPAPSPSVPGSTPPPQSTPDPAPDPQQPSPTPTPDSPTPTPTTDPPTPTPTPTTPKPVPLTVTNITASGSVTDGTSYTVTVRVTTKGDEGSATLTITENATNKTKTINVTGSDSFTVTFAVGNCEKPSVTATADGVTDTTPAGSTTCLR